MSNLKVLVLARYKESGSSLYRFYEFQPLLKQYGVELTIRPLFGPAYLWLRHRESSLLRNTALYTTALTALFDRFKSQMNDISDFDLVIVEGYLFPFLPSLLEMYVLRQGGRRPKLVFEYDDAIYLSANNGEKLAYLLRRADAIIVGNPWLAAWARSLNDSVHIVPTVINTGRMWPKSHVNLHFPARIGWIGQPYNFDMLDTVAPVLKKLSNSFSIEFHIISARQMKIKGVKTKFHRWSMKKESEFLRELDIGIMPLKDDEWSRGKCGMKLLQYLACGVPSVVSPYGVNQVIAENGESALLATTAEQWHESISKLLSSAELRKSLSEKGRKAIEEQYALDKWAPKVAELYRRIAGMKTE